jgi:hypothetical protein
MILKETIRRVLREDSKINLKLKRRSRELDKLVQVILEMIYPCDFSDWEHFKLGLLYEVRYYIMDGNNDTFNEFNVNDIMEYISENYKDEIKEFYEEYTENC